MLKDGRLYKEDGRYYLVNGGVKESNNSEWEEKYNELHGQYVKLEQELDKRKVGGTNDVGCNQSDLDFQIAENEKLVAKVEMYQEAIRRCYMRAVNVKKDKTPWPIFKKEVLKLEEDLPWEDNQ